MGSGEGGNDDMSEPVTIVVRRQVKGGREADYERWLARMTDGAATQFRGLSRCRVPPAWRRWRLSQRFPLRQH